MLDLTVMPQDCAGTQGARPHLRPGFGRGALPAWIFTPDAPCATAPPLVVAHGISRDAEGIARRLAARAQAQGRVVVAPLFSEQEHRGYQRAVGRRRADLALLKLLDALAAEGRIPRGPVDLAGFSGGAQFAHRFTWLYPHRVGRLAAAAAGWWTFPDVAPFPYGLGPAVEGPADAPRWMQANLADFLDRQIVVAVGARDCTPDAATRSGPGIDAQQGPDRLTRARCWTTAIRAAAERLGLPPRVDLRVLPDCGHDFQRCADAGLDRLFLPRGPGVRRLSRAAMKGAAT